MWNYSCFCPLLYGTPLNHNNKGEQPMRCKQQSLIRNATESEEQKHVLVLHYQSEWKPLSVKAPLIFLPKGSLVFLPAYLCDCPYSACNARPVSQITCLYTVLGPMVRHYALKYGLHTFPNLLKNLLERGTWLCLYTNALPLTSQKDTPRPRSILQNERHLDLRVSLWDPPRGQR